MLCYCFLMRVNDNFIGVLLTMCVYAVINLDEIKANEAVIVKCFVCFFTCICCHKK